MVPLKESGNSAKRQEKGGEALGWTCQEVKAQFKTRQRRGWGDAPRNWEGTREVMPPGLAGVSQGGTAPGEGSACSDPDTPGET